MKYSIYWTNWASDQFFLTASVYATMKCSSEVVVFACAYKRGVAGPNKIQNGGQIQNDYRTRSNYSNGQK